MRRPFFWPAVGLAAGILIARSPFLSRSETIAFTFLFVFVCLPFLWFFRGRPFFIFFFTLSLIGIGMLRARQDSTTPSNNLIHFVQGNWMHLEGKVVSLPEIKEKGRRRIYSFVLQSKNLSQEKKFFETSGRTQVFLFNPQGEVSYGQHIRLWGKLTLPKTPRNPGEFDYQKYLSNFGIQTVFEGYGPRSLKILDCRGEVSSPCGRGSPVPMDFFLTIIQKLRNVCALRFDQYFKPPANGFLKALILGLRKDLPEDSRDDFIKTGTAHLIAISGMNITLAAGSLFFLCIRLGFPQKICALVGILATVCYVFLSGAGIPVVRAGWMTSLFFIGILIEREKDLLNSLFFAFFIILICDPRSLFQVGFQLSFLSVLALIVSSHRPVEWHADWLQTLVVLAGTFPLIIVYFNIFSWISVLANLVAVPLFHLGVLGGWAGLLMVQIPILGHWIVTATSIVLKAGLVWIHFLAERPWGYVHLESASRSLVLFYYSALALFLSSRRIQGQRFSFLRPFSASLWLLTAALFFLPQQRSDFELTVFSAGRNELMHVQFPEKNHWLINSGRRTLSNQARWLISPFLRHMGVNRIGGILLTDFSPRHSEGLQTLLQNFPTASVMFPSAAKPPIDWNQRLRGMNRRINSLSLHAGDKISVQGGEVRILDVIEGHLFPLIECRGYRFFVLPTAKEKILQQVLPQLNDIGPVDVVILPALGNNSPESLKEILLALSPHWVVFDRKPPPDSTIPTELQKEEISFSYLTETGALQFQIRQGKFLILPFLGKSLH